MPINRFRKNNNSIKWIRVIGNEAGDNNLVNQNLINNIDMSNNAGNNENIKLTMKEQKI